MTTVFHYDVGLVLDDTGVPLPNAIGVFRLGTTSGPGAVATVTTASGDPAVIQTSRYGAFSRFQYTSADDKTGAVGYLDFNGIIQPVASIEVLNALPLAVAAQTAASAAQAAAAQSLVDLQAYVDAHPASPGGTGAVINDNAASSSSVYSSSKTASAIATAVQSVSTIADGTTASSSTWSSTKIAAAIQAAITALVNGAPTALDTLLELANQLSSDESATSALITTINSVQTALGRQRAPILGSAPGVLAAPTKGAIGLVIPYACTLDAVALRVGTAPTGSSLIIDVNINGNSIFGTGAVASTIAAGANQIVVGGLNIAVPANAWLSYDIDQVGSTVPGSDLGAASWLKL